MIVKPHKLFKEIEGVKKWVTYNAKQSRFYLTKNAKMAKVFRYTCPENNIKHFQETKHMKGLQYEIVNNDISDGGNNKLSTS